VDGTCAPWAQMLDLSSQARGWSRMLLSPGVRGVGHPTDFAGVPLLRLSGQRSRMLRPRHMPRRGYGGM
jgi:hypothetical protein